MTDQLDPPKDGTMVCLLVDYSDDGEAPLEDALTAWTIGYNTLADTGDDEWIMVGWDWCQDCYCQGNGKIIGWAPFAPTMARHKYPAPDAVAAAWRDVLAERQRQITVEGLAPEHDDAHEMAELAQAAACYALSGTPCDEAFYIHGRWRDARDLFWPRQFGREWWKPTDRRRDLVKAGALILAEIERLDRAALAAMETSHD